MAGAQVVSGGEVVTAADHRAAIQGDAAQRQQPATTSDTMRRGRTLAIVLVGLAMILGGTLRAVWADAYLPWQHHWDESTNVGVGEDMAAELQVDPGFYNYPALVFLAQTAVLLPAGALGDFDPDDQPIMEGQALGSAYVNEPGLLTAMRWATGVLPGMATIAGAGCIAWFASRRWWVAALAATIVALSAIDLRFGVFVTPDALTGTAATLAALGAVAITAQPTRARYLLTGAAIGLAAGAKYNGIAVAIGLVAAHLIAHRRPLGASRRLLDAAAAAVVVFCVTNVGAVMHPAEFVRGVGSEANHYGTGHFGAEGTSPVFNAGWLWHAFGLALVLATCSLLSTSDRVKRAGIVLITQAVAYYVFISAFPVRFARNLLPITGPVSAAAALGVFALVQRLAAWNRDGSARPAPRVVVPAAAAVLVLALLAMPVRGAASAMATLDDDPWLDAQTWVAENAPAGSKIVVENRAPVIDEDRYDVVVKGLLGSTDFATYQQTDVDYVIGVSETFEPFFDSPDDFPDTTESYRKLLAPGCIVEEFEGAGQRIVIASPRSC
jgi:hypothetical protein